MKDERIGILGGAFDPPQIGHLILAEYGREALSLDRVLFVPVGDHPVKKQEVRLPLAHRLAMLQLAVCDHPAFEISRVDIDRQGPHYSADMVKIIGAQNPGAALFFLMGGDNFCALPSWERPEELYRCCRLAVMKRADEEFTLDMHDAALPGLSRRADLVDVPMLSVWVSSTYVVNRIRAGRSVRYLAPDPVLEYIRAHNLYR